MKIKRLELTGFKSFVDRTVVVFDHAIVGIVGPNGCGKSNIVDAIRWCMGEQSAKHLRGKAMEDVIFGGSESRPPADFAEVTLTFDNDDPSGVPTEYTDYAEIAVTRRLYRSGDSEYLINKTAVRLKDITDLFLGTGVGTKAYSIVEQGKIGLIVSAKPEERRLLIEEAAGITKFKSRKKQAERKMELTQQNLARVGDIIAEIDRSLGTLRRQAAKAERYLAYRHELEDLELYDASHKFLELRGWIRLESEEVLRLGLEADKAKVHLATSEAELESARQQVLAAEDQLEHASTASFAADNDVRAEQVAIERATDRLESLHRRQEQATIELSEVKNQLCRLFGERKTVESDIAVLEQSESSEAAVVKTHENKLAAFSAEHQSAERELAKLGQVLGRAQAAIAASEATLQGYTRRKTDMLGRAERLASERGTLENGVVELRAHAKELATIASDLRARKEIADREKIELEARLANLKLAIAKSEQALDAAKTEASTKRSRLAALTEMRARHEGVGAGAKALVDTKHDAVIGLLADHIEAPAEFTSALAALLGSHLEDVVVSDIESGISLLTALAESRQGRATIVPRHPKYVVGRELSGLGFERLVDKLRYAPENEDLVRAVIGNAVVVDDVDAALRIRRDVDAPIVTRNGTVFHVDGRVSGGTGEQAAAHMLEVAREMRELSGQVARLEHQVEGCASHHQSLRSQIGEAQGMLDRARQLAHQGELALLHADKDHAAAENQANAHAKRLEVLGAELESLTLAITEADIEHAAEAEALEGARADLLGMSEQIAHAERTLVERRNQVAAQQVLVMDRRVKLAQLREKLSAERTTAERLARSEAELVEREKRLDTELCDGEREAGETASMLHLHRDRLGETIEAAKVAQGSLAESRAAFEALREGMQNHEVTLRDLRAIADRVKDDLARHEMALREHELAMMHLVESVREKFRGLALGHVVGDYHLRPPPDATVRSRTSELASLIDRMGAVNLDATREYEEAEKRFAFYTDQKADLDKAIAHLEQAIGQMNRESKKLFEDTFVAVNARFREIFPKMFRGGRAELRLTNPADMLETGIEIVAQPPGKKLSSIELMSGGEKALTAVSLIFAIFQCKPSPFCILDEVDAPLDEANVGRYCEMVRTMTDTSQFILITHIKKTMQFVDMLSGVTMGEPGVSRLVTVKVTEAIANQSLPVKAGTVQPAAAVAAVA